jgi:hypothetical protein
LGFSITLIGQLQKLLDVQIVIGKTNSREWTQEQQQTQEPLPYNIHH